MCPRGWRARPTPWACPPTSWTPHGSPHLSLHPHTSSCSRKNHPPAQTQVLAHLAAIFDLLAQSSIHKTALGDCSSVCVSSNGPILSGYQDYFLAPLPGSIALFFESLGIYLPIIMKNLRDPKTKIYPSTRGEVRNCHLALHLIHLLF